MLTSRAQVRVKMTDSISTTNTRSLYVPTATLTVKNARQERRIKKGITILDRDLTSVASTSTITVLALHITVMVKVTILALGITTHHTRRSLTMVVVDMVDTAEEVTEDTDMVAVDMEDTAADMGVTAEDTDTDISYQEIITPDHIYRYIEASFVCV